MNTEKPDDLDRLKRDAKDLADKYPKNKPSQILHAVVKATVDNTRRTSTQARLGLLAAVGGLIVAAGGLVNTLNDRSLAGRVSQLENAPKRNSPSAQGGDPQRNPIDQERKEKNPVQPERAPLIQESKPEPHIESMPPMTIKPENKGKKSTVHSILAEIMQGDTGALNSKMAVAMAGSGSELKIGQGRGSMGFRGPSQTSAQSRRALQQVLRGK